MNDVLFYFLLAWAIILWLAIVFWAIERLIGSLSGCEDETNVRPNQFMPTPGPPPPPRQGQTGGGGKERVFYTAHDLKTWPPSFAAIRTGDKTAEFRSTADRTFHVGDDLFLREYVPTSEDWEAQGFGREDYPYLADAYGYTGEFVEATVTHITEGFGIPEGYAMLSFRKEEHGLG